MLVEIAISDAYGAGREFAPPRWTRKHNDVKSYRNRPGSKKEDDGIGRYTDDTQKTLSLSLLMLERDISACSSLDLADKIIEVYKRDPHGGHAKGFRSVLEESETGADLIRILHPHSIKAGGAMGAAPCGLLGTPMEVLDAAVWQASLTHATLDGAIAAGAAALLVWGCRRGIPVAELPVLLDTWLPGPNWQDPWIGPVGNVGMQVVLAALTAIRQGKTLSEILYRSIYFTGDVDSVAAIALGAASVHPNIPNDLAPELYANLENGEYGRDYLKVLDEKLLARYPIVL